MRRLLLVALLGSLLLPGCLQPPPEAPDFTMATASGGTVQLSELEGRVVVLDVMATTCAPCKKQMPHLVELTTTYPDVAIVSMSTNPASIDSDEELLAWKARWNATWPHGRDPGGVAADYRVTTIPAIIVIDADGRITYKSPTATAIDRATLFQQVEAVR